MDDVTIKQEPMDIYSSSLDHTSPAYTDEHSALYQEDGVYKSEISMNLSGPSSSNKASMQSVPDLRVYPIEVIKQALLPVQDTDDEDGMSVHIKQDVDGDRTSNHGVQHSNEDIKYESSDDDNEQSDFINHSTDLEEKTAIKHEPDDSTHHDPEPSGSARDSFGSSRIMGDFSCLWPTCPETFPDPESLLTHMKCHQTQPQQCEICQKVLQTDACFREHMLLHQAGYSFFCSVINCNVGFETESQLRVHNRTHVTKPIEHDCQRCGQKFTYKVQLKKHMREHRLNDPIICQEQDCKRKFQSVERLQHHRETCHEHYECLFCNRVFPIQKKLRQHLRTTHGDKTNFMCTFEGCNKGFKVKDSLRKHLLSHSTERNYKCGDCGMAFKFDHSLRLHKQKQSLNAEYPCGVDGCSQVFAKGCMLKVHKTTAHNISSQVTCWKCGQVMPVRDLQWHNRSIHNQVNGHEKVVSCPIEGCDGMFTSKAGLNIHNRRYHKRKAEKLRVKLELEAAERVHGTMHCTGCGLKFRSASSLNEHKAQQTSIQNICTFKDCNRTFTTECILKIHQFIQHLANPFGKSQNPNRPFICPYEGCKSCYARATGLKRHFKVSHGYWECEDVQSCPVDNCEKKEKFKYKVFLEEHILSDHKHLAPTGKPSSHGSVQGGPGSSRASVKSDTTSSDNDSRFEDQLMNSKPKQDPATVPRKRIGEEEQFYVEESQSNLRQAAVKKPITCKECGRVCANLKKFRRHLTYCHHHIAVLVCSHEGCEQTFKNIQSFMGHRRTHIPRCNPKAEPPLAEVTSVYSEKLPLGYARTPLVQDILCPDCGTTYSTKTSFKRHRRLKHQPQNAEVFVCDFEGCGKEFTFRDYFTKHKRVHFAVKDDNTAYLCPVPGCNRSYKTRPSLIRHRRAHRTTQPKVKHPCPLPSCSAMFISKEKVKMHMAMHSGNFDCHICGKTLSSKYSLKVHLEHHTTKRTVHCEVEGCEKTFHNEKERQRHMRYHKGIKRHQCPEPGCTATFYFPCQIPRHLERHKKGSVFVCDECPKNFQDEANLNRHKSAAHGANALARRKRVRVTCDQPACNMTFHSSYGQKRHLMVVHKQVETTFNYGCPIEGCEAVFLRKIPAVSHIKKFHGLESVTTEPIQFGAPGTSGSNGENQFAPGSAGDKMDEKDGSQSEDQSCGGVVQPTSDTSGARVVDGDPANKESMSPLTVVKQEPLD